MKILESTKEAGTYLLNKVQHPHPISFKIAKIAFIALATITAAALAVTFYPAIIETIKFTMLWTSCIGFTAIGYAGRPSTHLLLIPPVYPVVGFVLAVGIRCFLKRFQSVPSESSV